ncbi:hypothetical protein CKF54_08055 [Psittacicella hinzii]|uniref:BPL/LPL catalytic domain-containing protein n=1 Tax=Psittacicella hinzii TaxID=2028575 RepID=A0A3A1XYC5_9GAMM|nr:hypothetical protein [Psittacicella hinzii]RIY31032.1 hypothetical protein CKF54_08055 [Psittacicella hinzii]
MANIINRFKNNKILNIYLEKFLLNELYLTLAKYSFNKSKFKNFNDLVNKTIEELLSQRTKVNDYIQKLNSSFVLSEDPEIPDEIDGQILLLDFCKHEMFLKYFEEYCVVIEQDFAVTKQILNKKQDFAKRLEKSEDRAHNFTTLNEQENNLLLKQAPFIYVKDRIYTNKVVLGAKEISYLEQLNQTVDIVAKNTLLIQFFALSSTNLYAETCLEDLDQGLNLIIISFYQYRGIGRSYKPWISMPFADLTCSAVISNKDINPELANTFSLHVANCIHYEINQFLLRMRPWNWHNKLLLEIKWPNDIYLDNKKCAGILISQKGNHFIVGFGINFLSQPDWVNDYYDQPINTLISPVLSETLSLNEMAAYLQQMSKAVYKTIRKNSEQRHYYDYSYYSKNNFFKEGDDVSIIERERVRTATFKEINQQGHLVLKESDGQETVYNVPRISIRKV